jgi:hypothetical protein
MRPAPHHPIAKAAGSSSFRHSKKASKGVIFQVSTTREVPMNAFYEHHKDSIGFGYRCFDRILLNETSANEPLMTHRNTMDDIKTGLPASGNSMAETYLPFM